MSRTSTLIRRLVGRPVETAGDGAVSVGDERQAPGTGGSRSGTNGWRFSATLAIAAVTLGVVVVNALSAAHDAARRGEPYDLGPPLFYEMTSGLVIVALLLPIRHAVSWLSAGRAWWQVAAGIAGFLVLFSGAHILGMIALRIAGAWLVGGSYQFDWAHDLPYEFRKDLLSLTLIGGCFWLSDRRRARPPTGDQDAPQLAAPPETLWLKDGTTTIRVAPGAILAVTSAGNYVEFDLGDRRHLVRGTLTAEEARLAPHRILRVHRTRLVNLGRVVQMSPTASGDFTLQLDTGATVAGSRRYREAVASALGRV